MHATLARFLLATVLICCGLIRAITGVYNAMFGTSLLVHHSQRPLCLLSKIQNRHVGFGPAMDIDTHTGASPWDEYIFFVPTYAHVDTHRFQVFLWVIRSTQPIGSQRRPTCPWTCAYLTSQCLLFLAPSLVRSCVHRAGMPSWPPLFWAVVRSSPICVLRTSNCSPRHNPTSGVCF